MVQFIFIFNESFYVTTDFYSKENKFNNIKLDTLIYEHLYKFYSREDESVITDLKNHIEYIKNELSRRFKDQAKITVFFSFK